MTKIETIKAAVSVPEAAERYGLIVTKTGMTLCPFHEDRHPSLRLYDDHFYCFTCAAHGDVIDLTAKLLGVSIQEAIDRLASDFRIGSYDDLPKSVRPARSHISKFRDEELMCVTVLTDYERLLRRWKSEFAPKTSDEIPDDRYVEACQMLDQIECLADFLCSSGLEDRIKAVEELIENDLIQKIKNRLEEFKNENKY